MQLVTLSDNSTMTTATRILFFTVVLAISDAAHLGRIIGGSSAPNHAYPYQVSIQLKTSIGLGFHFCSGSILNERWILTAGHCTQGKKVEGVIVVAGTNYLDRGGDMYDVELMVAHDNFTNFYYDDIALIRVTEDVKFNEYVSPVSLPTEDFDEDGVPAVFSGWGSTKLWGPSPNNLQEIQLRIVTNKQCRESQDSVTPQHICSFTKDGEGICHGDSGGPLLAKGSQVGIASYVRPCAVGDPDVYTRVYKYIDWIRKTQQRFDH